MKPAKPRPVSTTPRLANPGPARYAHFRKLGIRGPALSARWDTNHQPSNGLREQDRRAKWRAVR